MKALQIGAVLAVLAVAPLRSQGSKPVYLDPAQPMERRIADVISRMTLEEKAAQLNHLSSRNLRLQIPPWGGWNQTLHGVWSKQPTTLFPTAIGMAATWDPALIKTITGAMSDEARALYNIAADGPRSKHGLVFRSPVINISRDPRWGRIQECFGEDPYLAGRITVAYVQGLQGNHPKYLKVAATLGGSSGLQTLTNTSKTLTLSLASVVNTNGILGMNRSEERRVGKECRSRWAPHH